MNFPFRFLAIATASIAPAIAQTYIGSGNSSWNTASNWSTNTVPGTGADIVFNTPNPDSAAQQITLNVGATVSSITYNNNSTGTNAQGINWPFNLAGTTNSLIFDAPSGNAHVTVNGTGTGINSIVPSVLLVDDLVITVNNSTLANTFSFTGAVSGAGGIVKEGAGIATLGGTTSKIYTGATIINAGALRIQNTSIPSATASVTVNSGGQLRLDVAADYTFGSSSAPPTVTIAGAGASDTGVGIGALRFNNATATLDTNFHNPVAIAADATIFVNANTTNADRVTLDGPLTGSGRLTKVGTGTLILTGPATLPGGITVGAGSLSAGGTNLSGITGSLDLVGGTFATSGSSTAIGGALNLESGGITLNGTAAGTLIAPSFTMSGGTLTLTLGSSYDFISGNGTGSFAITGGTFSLDVTGAGFSYDASYALLQNFLGGSIANLNFTGYDTDTYSAHLSNSGLLTFSAAAVPEPSTLFVFASALTAMSLVRRPRFRR